MAIGDRNRTGRDVGGDSRAARVQRAIADVQRSARADQAAADRDQTAADLDQTLSDADQTTSVTEQAEADRDQVAADRDQTAADRAHDSDGGTTDQEEREYLASRLERDSVAHERDENRLRRATSMRERNTSAKQRDKAAEARDAEAIARDARSADLTASTDGPLAELMHQLEAAAAEAAADRARAAADRDRAASDRAKAARVRARLEAKLRAAHLDELTGAYRREAGRLALSHEIDRARRSDGRFVLAFVDVDELKLVNDRDGHAAGDRLLQIVVREVRLRLRSFDPIIRFGGDEFICGLSGTDIAEAERRFEAIADAIREDADAGISVGLAALTADDTIESLTERADVGMLEMKTRHRSRKTQKHKSAGPKEAA